MSTARKHLHVVNPEGNATPTPHRENRRRPNPIPGIFTAFGIVATILLGAEAIETRMTTRLWTQANQFPSSAAGSLESFQAEKHRFHVKVAQAIRSPFPEVRAAAESLAVYFFPELLDDENFEKAEALMGWSDLALRIEATAHSAEALRFFRQMEAMVSVYEHGASGVGVSSAEMELFLRTYERLSAP